MGFVIRVWSRRTRRMWPMLVLRFDHGAQRVADQMRSGDVVAFRVGVGLFEQAALDGDEDALGAFADARATGAASLG